MVHICYCEKGSFIGPVKRDHLLKFGIYGTWEGEIDFSSRLQVNRLLNLQWI